MGLIRTPHWATRELHRFLLERAAVPFAWGTNDCALFAADAIASFTGVDLAAEFRGKYADEHGAFWTIRRVTGGKTVADAAAWCAARHGLTEWARPALAQRGDLVIVQNGENLIGGIVHLNGRSVASVGAEGLVVLPHSAIVRSWHV